MKKRTKVSQDKFVFFALLGFFVLRIAIIFCAPVHHSFSATSFGISNAVNKGTDSDLYNKWAIQKLSFWRGEPGELRVRKETGYSTFLAGVYTLCGPENFLAVYVIQAVLSVISAYFIFAISMLLFQRETIGKISVVLAGSYGWYLWYVPMLLRETLVIFLLTGLLYSTCRIVIPARSRSAEFPVFGLLFTGLLFVDGRYIYLYLFFVMIGLIYRARRWFFAMLGVLFLLHMGLGYAHRETISRWQVFDQLRSIYRTYYKENRVFRKPHSGVTSYIANPSYPDSEERARIKSGGVSTRSPEEVDAIKRDKYPAQTLLQRASYYAVELWRPYCFKGDYSPFPGCFFRIWSLRHNLLSMLVYFPILLCGMCGLVHLVGVRDRRAWFFVLLFFLHTVIHASGFAETRYRVPVDFLLLILSAYSIEKIIRALFGPVRREKTI